MQERTTVRTAVADVALSNTAARDDDVLAALCETTLSATRAACLSRRDLLDWDEFEATAEAL